MGINTVKSSVEFHSTVSRHDNAQAGKAAGDYINSNAGAADKCFKAIFEGGK